MRNLSCDAAHLSAIHGNGAKAINVAEQYSELITINSIISTILQHQDIVKKKRPPHLVAELQSSRS